MICVNDIIYNIVDAFLPCWVTGMLVWCSDSLICIYVSEEGIIILLLDFLAMLDSISLQTRDHFVLPSTPVHRIGQYLCLYICTSVQMVLIGSVLNNISPTKCQCGPSLKILIANTKKVPVIL